MIHWEGAHSITVPNVSPATHEVGQDSTVHPGPSQRRYDLGVVLKCRL